MELEHILQLSWNSGVNYLNGARTDTTAKAGIGLFTRMELERILQLKLEYG